MWQLLAAGKCFGGEKSVRAIKMASRFMMIDDDTLKDLLRIDDDLFQVCKWLNEKRDTATSSRLMPLVDELTHILMRLARTNCNERGLMPRYLARACPRCDGYVGIVIREPEHNLTLQAVNGRYTRCCYRMAQSVIRGKRTIIR